MKLMLQRILRPSLRQSARRTTSFNGRLLDQKREEAYVAMHRSGFVR